MSPEAASGKTRVLEVLDLLVPESMFALSASSAAVFRSLAQRQVTLLFDEVDTIWKWRGKDDSNEDLRALLNAGYKRGATIPRCVGHQFDVKNFKVFCAVALAGLGDLPETIMSRSVIIKMRRRAPDETVEPFRSRPHASIEHALKDRLAEWANRDGASIGEAWPDLPQGIIDRAAEIWEPLLAVADAAGGPWPEKSRSACTALCKTIRSQLPAVKIDFYGLSQSIPTEPQWNTHVKANFIDQFFSTQIELFTDNATDSAIEINVDETDYEPIEPRHHALLRADEGAYRITIVSRDGAVLLSRSLQLRDQRGELEGAFYVLNVGRTNTYKIVSAQYGSNALR